MSRTSNSPRQASDALKAARAYHNAGLSLIPIATDGTKGPDFEALPKNQAGKSEWKRYQRTLPSKESITNWFGNGRVTGIGIIGGKVSRGLVIIDFDCLQAFEKWRELVRQLLPKLFAKLAVIKTPSGGRHVYFRTTASYGSTKLARVRTPEGKIKTLIEIKAEGGYCVAPGSPKECHETGGQYIHGSGPTIVNVSSISRAEADTLIKLARSLDKCTEVIKESVPAKTNRPGDDYNRKAAWDDVLVPHGWQKLHQITGVTFWRRPGKRTGVSATTGYCISEHSGDQLYVFSSNAAPLEDGVAYSKFAAKTLLEFGGDFAKCTKALSALRFGEGPQDDSGEPQIDLGTIEPLSLESGLEVFRKWLVDLDTEALELVLGVVAANALQADPVFLFVVGPPSSGKTELVRALYGHPATKHLTTVTPAALISGYESAVFEPSLIPKLDGKTLVIKDFTPVLEMNREKRAEVFSVFRDAYDGHCGKSFGNGKSKSFRSRFNIIAAVTGAIDQCTESMQSLGERFLRINIQTGDRRLRTVRSLQNANREQGPFPVLKNGRTAGR